MRKLTAVLAYLERRIAGMLEPGAQADAPDPESAANAERLIESDASVPEGSAVQGHSTEELTVGVPRSMGAGVLPDAAPEPPNSSEMGAEQPRPSLRLPKAEDSTASPPADIGLASTLESPDQPSSPATGESAPVASDRVELAAPTNVSAVSHTQHEFAVDEPLSSAAVAQPAHADVSAYSQESTTPDPSHPVTSLEDRQPNQAEDSAVPAPETNPQVELDDHAAASREESDLPSNEQREIACSAETASTGAAADEDAPDTQQGTLMIPQAEAEETSASTISDLNQGTLIPSVTSLGPSPFEQPQAGAADLAAFPVASEAEGGTSIATVAEDPIAPLGATEAPALIDTAMEAPADLPAEPSAAPDVAALAEPSEPPHDDILSGAWELAVLKSPEEAVQSKEAQDARRGAVASETRELDAIAEIERELFVSATGDSDVEIEEELFVSSPLPSASEIPSIPLLAEPSPVPAQTKSIEASIARGMIAQIATTIGAPTQPDGEAPLVMPARPISRSMPRPLPTDPLAALKALTDEERIALFT